MSILNIAPRVADARRGDLTPRFVSANLVVVSNADDHIGRRATDSAGALKHMANAFDSTVREFSMGLDGERPDDHIVDLADRLIQKTRAQTEEPEITIDVDGALSFDLRLTSGLLMFAELAIDGTLDVTVLNDSGPGARLVKHLPAATESAFVDQL